MSSDGKKVNGSNALGFESKDFIRAAIYKIQLEIAKRKIKK